MMMPGRRATKAVVRRMLLRIRAYRTLAVAKEMGVGCPEWAADAIVSTNGVELEAKHFLKMVRAASPKNGTR